MVEEFREFRTPVEDIFREYKENTTNILQAKRVWFAEHRSNRRYFHIRPKGNFSPPLQNFKSSSGYLHPKILSTGTSVNWVLKKCLLSSFSLVSFNVINILLSFYFCKSSWEWLWNITATIDFFSQVLMEEILFLLARTITFCIIILSFCYVYWNAILHWINK